MSKSGTKIGFYFDYTYNIAETDFKKTCFYEHFSHEAVQRCAS